MLEQHRAEPHEAIRADTAYIIDQPARGRHPARHRRRPRRLNWPLGGKTGTTDDYTDAWFIGFDPDITIGVWVGFDQKKPIGTNQTGTVAALPIWQEIMKSWIDAPAPGTRRAAGLRTSRQHRHRHDRPRTGSLHRRDTAAIAICYWLLAIGYCIGHRLLRD